MVRAEPYKAWRVRTSITDALEKKKKEMNRHDSMTAFIEWVLDLYVLGKLTEVREIDGGKVLAASAHAIGVHGKRKTA